MRICQRLRGLDWNHVGSSLNWTAMAFWGKGGGGISKLRGGTLETRRGGSRQKHIIEGRRSANEGSMHRGPQLLTPPSSPQIPPRRSRTIASCSCRFHQLSVAVPPPGTTREKADGCSIWKGSTGQMCLASGLFSPPSSSAPPHPIPSTASQQRDVSGSPRTLLLLFKIF